MDFLLLALHPVVFPDPGVECIFINPQITGRLCNRLLGFDREFDGAFLKFRGILFDRGLTHPTPLFRYVVSVSPCVRKSIATSWNSLGRASASGSRLFWPC